MSAARGSVKCTWVHVYSCRTAKLAPGNRGLPRFNRSHGHPLAVGHIAHGLDGYRGASLQPKRSAFPMCSQAFACEFAVYVRDGKTVGGGGTFQNAVTHKSAWKAQAAPVVRAPLTVDGRWVPLVAARPR